MNKDLLFIIYSCHYKLELAEKLYDVLKDKLDYCKVYICVGNPESETGLLNDKYIVLKIGDQYGDQSNKTICLLNSIPQLFKDYKGVFKCNDDIIPNISSINNYSKEFLENNIEYAGNTILYSKEHIYCLTFLKPSNNNPIYTYMPPNIKYCARPLYYINLNTIKKFNEIKKDYMIFYEDVLIGYYLNKCNIIPKELTLYYDEIENFKLASYQNIDNKTKNLYIMLSGRLGNNLFQIASGYGIAMKYKMNLFLMFDENESYNISKNYVYRDTIFKNKNLLFINKNLINATNIYSEVNEENNHMVYNPNIIKHNNGIAIEDTIINGYLQNEKYFKDYKQDIINLFKNNHISKLLLEQFINIKDCCFIHIRRGDFVTNKPYWIDNDKYYKSAIEYMLHINNNMQFIILSDDIEYCKTYKILNNLNIIFVENLDVQPSLYLMTLTKYGIMSNSTFAWWGGYMNQTPDKIIIMPKIWWNNNLKPCDIYFEGAIILES